MAISYTLDQNQLDGIAFCTSRLRSILAFSTGCGKSLVALESAERYIKQYPDMKVVIVCPPSAMNSWKGDLSKFFDYYPSIYTVDNQVFNPRSNYTIFNYSSIDKYAEQLNTLIFNHKCILILDEAHILGNATISYDKKLDKWGYESVTYDLFRKIIPRFSVVMVLTATPIQNDIEKTWGLVNIIQPGFLGTLNDFRLRYTIRGQQFVKGGRTTPVVKEFKDLHLLSKRLEPLVIVRSLPFKVHFHYHDCNLSPELVKPLTIASQGSTTKRKDFAAARLHDLQQVVDSSSLLLDGQLPKGFVSEKEKRLIELLYGIFKTGGSALLYTTHLETVTRLEALLNASRHITGLNKIYKITGSVKKSTRYQQANQIGSRDVCLVTSAGSESLNIGQVNHVILYSAPFSIREFQQMLGRITRKTHVEFDKYVHFITTLGTIDEYKKHYFQLKASTITALIGQSSSLNFEVLQWDLDYKAYLSKTLLWNKPAARPNKPKSTKPKSKGGSSNV